MESLKSNHNFSWLLDVTKIINYSIMMQEKSADNNVDNKSIYLKQI